MAKHRVQIHTDGQVYEYDVEGDSYAEAAQRAHHDRLVAEEQVRESSKRWWS